MSTVVQRSHRGTWRAAHRALFIAFLAAAACNRADVRAGFATSHLADLVVPAWLYIVLRGLHGPRRRPRLYRVLGATRESTAALLFVGSTLTEFSQSYWPAGLFAGTYDPLDIAAYGVGVGVCYALDRSDRQAASSSAGGEVGEIPGTTHFAETNINEPPDATLLPAGSAGGDIVGRPEAPEG